MIKNEWRRNVASYVSLRFVFLNFSDKPCLIIKGFQFFILRCAFSLLSSQIAAKITLNSQSTSLLQPPYFSQDGSPPQRGLKRPPSEENMNGVADMGEDAGQAMGEEGKRDLNLFCSFFVFEWDLIDRIWPRSESSQSSQYPVVNMDSSEWILVATDS